MPSRFKIKDGKVTESGGFAIITEPEAIQKLDDDHRKDGAEFVLHIPNTCFYYGGHWY